MTATSIIDINKIMQKKRRGDIALAAKMLSISTEYANNAFNNPRSKYHLSVLVALEYVIGNREQAFLIALAKR